jgi:putative phage-type endonuclease
MRYGIIDIELNSDNWKEMRREFIGASDAPIIMGVSPWKTPLQLWEEKMTKKESPLNEAMSRGIAMEPITRQKINDKLRVNYKPICVHSLLYDWMVATLDGWDDEAIVKGCEIKNPGKDAHQMARERKIPHYYIPQLQHQMIVTDQKEWLYLSEYQNEVIEIVANRDEKYCEQLLQEERKFYQSLISFKPPTASDKDYVKIEDANAIILSRTYATVVSQIEELEKQKEEIRNILIESAKHPRQIVGELKMCKSLRLGNVQYNKIPEIRGIDLNKYRSEPLEVWKIS